MRGLALFGVRKAALGAVLLVGLASITFWVNYAIPQDAGMFLLGNVPNPTREQVEEANHRLGVDRPALEQYGDFLGDLARADLGISWTTAAYVPDEGVVGEPVSGLVLRAASVTGSLVIGALVLLVGRRLGWLPDRGYCPFFGTGPGEAGSGPCGGPLDWASHLVLPWLSFGLLFLALYVRQIRTQSMSVLGLPFVNVARAKGASERQVITRHVVPSVLTVVGAMVAMDVGTALGIALFVEVVFGLPGLGFLLITALQDFAGFDRPVIVGIVLVTGTVVIVANLAADLVAGVIDPRVRVRGARGAPLGGGDG